MAIIKGVGELIGNTPLLMANAFTRAAKINCKLFVKLETANPYGSVKDRTAYYLVNRLKQKGVKKGSLITTASSGNFALSLAAFCHLNGYFLVVVLLDNVSKKKQRLIKAYGGRVILCDKNLGMQGACEIAKSIANKQNGIYLDQFSDNGCILAHYESTAREIYRDLNGNIDCMVLGIGTGATAVAIAKYFKQKNSKISFFAVEPKNSAVLLGNKGSPHKIEGIGAGFIPPFYDSSLFSGVLTVSESEAHKYLKLFYDSEGFNLGMASGANLAGVVKAAKAFPHLKSVVTIATDSIERYV